MENVCQDKGKVKERYGQSEGKVQAKQGKEPTFMVFGSGHKNLRLRVKMLSPYAKRFFGAGRKQLTILDYNISF